MACSIVLVVFLGLFVNGEHQQQRERKIDIFKLNGTKSNSAQENNIFGKNVRIKYNVVLLLVFFLWNYRTGADLY